MNSPSQEHRAWAFVTLITGLLLCALALVDLPGILDAHRGVGRPGVAVVETVDIGSKGAVTVRGDVRVDGRAYDDVVLRGVHDPGVVVGQRIGVLQVRHALEPTFYPPGHDDLGGAVGGVVLGLVTAAYGLIELLLARSRSARESAEPPAPRPGRHRRQDPPRDRARPVVYVLQRGRRSA